MLLHGGKRACDVCAHARAALPDPEKLLEGTGKGVRHVKLRGVADVMRPGLKKLIAEAARLNKKDPPSGMMVGMEKRKGRTKKP